MQAWERASELNHRDGLWARAANLLLGGWMVVSAFAWDAAGPPRTNAAVVGYLIFISALLATGLDRARRLSTLLGLWLLASVWLLPAASVPMRINTALVGAAVCALSMVTRSGDFRPIAGWLTRRAG